MSRSPSDKSSSHNSPKPQEAKIEQNCKVYVSNINRDARDEDIRETFEKFGKIKYFAMKRKPQDVVYAFIEYNTYQEANQAVTKMDKSIFLKRTLNVQFGRGGKHQQKHYEALSIPPQKYRDFNSRERQDRQSRYQQNQKRYENRRKSDKITPKGSRSPYGNYESSKKYYRDEKTRQGRRDDERRQDSRDRGFNKHDSRRRDYDDKNYKKDDKRHSKKYSPFREERRSYDKHDKYPEKRYDEKKEIVEKEKDLYRRKEKSGPDDHEREDKRYEGERRNKFSDNYERNIDRYGEQNHQKRQRYQKEKSQSPPKDKYSRSYRDRQDQRRLYDDRYRDRTRRDRDDYQREKQRDRQTIRSRSREKSSHKQKSHRRDQYEQDPSRKQPHRYQRQHPRGLKNSRSPRKNYDRKRRHSSSEDRKRRNSESSDRRSRRNSRSEDRSGRKSRSQDRKRSYSPYRMPYKKRYTQRNQPQNSSYRNDEYKRYPHPYVRNPRTYQNSRQTFKEKGVETPMAFSKDQKVQNQSKSRSPQKPRLVVEQPFKNVRFSSEKQISPRHNGNNNNVQYAIKNQGQY